MAKLDLSVIVKTVGQQNLKSLNGQLAAVDTQATKTTGKFGALGSALGSLISPQTALIAGGVALAGAFSAAAKAAIEEEKGVALLTQAIEANDPASKDQIDNIEATITERQKLAFADDEQRESLGSLISVTKDSNKALELQRTAMDLARLKGIDLATASNILGKVYAGNTGILSRYGIQLEKGATATEAIAELQRRSAGQAEAYAETTAGAFESAQLAMDDVVEDIGSALLPALTEIAIVTRDDIIPAFRGMAEALEVVGGAGEVVEGLINAFNPGAAFAESFAEEVDKATERINDLEQAGKTTATTMPRNIQAMVDAMSKGGPVIATEAGKIAGMLPSAIQEHVDEVKTAAENMLGPDGLAGGILAAQNEPIEAIEELNRVMDESLSDLEQIGLLTGEDTLKALNKGLNSDVLVDRLTAKDAVAKIVEQLNTLGPAGAAAAAALLSSLNLGLQAPDPLAQIRQSSLRLAGIMTAPLMRSEPKDPRSPMRGMTHWGEDYIGILASDIEANLGTAASASRSLAATLIPSVAGVDGPAGSAASGGGGIHYHTHLTVQGDLKAANAQEAEDALLRVSRFSAVGGQA